MYGIVMMTALTTGVDAPAAHPSGPVVMGCYGCGAGCFGSCYGCNGCYGHGHKQGGGLFGHHRASCHGCSGLSCSGWSCFGSCNGCAGSACYGGGCVGGGHFHGCWGPSPAQFPYPPMAAAGPVMSYSDPWAVYGRVNAPPAVIVPADARSSDVKPMETPVAPKPKEGMGANLRFKLPAEAKLYVDGRLTMIGGTERSFSTPPLADGSKYYYDVKAEVIIDGKPLVEEKRVLVEAGATVNESFPLLIAAVEGKTTPVAGK
jgi:uncharacterized protein (TIGR03000 family)